MKQLIRRLKIARNIACGVGFAFCVIPLGLLYKIEEGFILAKRRRKKEDLSKPTHEPFKSFYPEGWYPDCTTEDFNKWAEHINRQLN